MIAIASPRVSESVLEVRFKPDPRVLDRRGEWADVLSAKLGMSRWQIIENRLDLSSEKSKERAFLSFRNFGYIADDVRGPDAWRERASAVVHAIFRLSGFHSPLLIERIGVRGRFCMPFSGTFAELREAFSQSYVGPADPLMSALGEGVRLEDVGAPLNFSDELGNFNTTCGPMGREQLGEFFKKRSDLPEVGLYYDIDYWQRSERAMDVHDLAKVVGQYSKAVWRRLGQVNTLVCGEAERSQVSAAAGHAE